MPYSLHGERSRLAGLTLAAALLASACGFHEDTAANDERLPELRLDPASLTVSGPSAGGYMAVQFHIAHSSLVNGAGVLAAGPYFCAANSMRDALGRCMKGDSAIPTPELVSLTSRLALDGAVDPIADLASDRVWIFHGGADPAVGKPVVDALQAYYETLVDPKLIKRVELAQAGHVFPASDADLPACGSFDPPYVSNCGLDGAREMLEHLYGEPFGAKATPGAGQLKQFLQTPYATAASAAGLAEQGWLYVPATCAGDGAARCRLHVAFHGCKQGSSFVGDAFVRRSGYLAAADAGNVVVLFPQIEPSYQPLNPMGCWDWWGYGSNAYATKVGPQVMAIKAMIDDLLGDAAAARPRD